MTPTGLKTNPKLVESVTNIQDHRMSRKLYVPGAKLILPPLHKKLCQHCTAPACPYLNWSGDSLDRAMPRSLGRLKSQLTTAPVLHYPSVDFPFTLETDASIKGLGTFLSQTHDDHIVYPVAGH